MKLTIFGASGRTGQPLVQQALNDGHEVTALVRTPAKLTIQHPRLTVIQGDVMNAAQVEQAIPVGTDAVITALSPTKNTPAEMLSVGAENILNAMRKRGVRRVIWMTGAGVRAPQDQPGLFDNVMRFALKTMAGEMLKHSELAVQKVSQSDLDWVVVRAPVLTNGDHTGKYRVGWVGVNTGTRLARADAADFMLKQVSDNRYVRQMPMVTN